MASLRHFSTASFGNREPAGSITQTFSAAISIRRYRDCTPLSVARLAVGKRRAMLYTSLSAGAATAAPAAATAIPPISSNLLARLVMNLSFKVLIDDTHMRRRRARPSQPAGIEFVPICDGFVPHAAHQVAIRADLR